MKIGRLLPFVFALGLHAKTPKPIDPFEPLAFLEGTWEAKAIGNAGIAVDGKYMFGLELRNHVLARHTVSKDSCKAPEPYNCDHSDLLYIYPEGTGPKLKAIYFDNQGHVIYYDISTPSPSTVVFLSDSSQSGPRYRLLYERKAEMMFGKFQIQLPGQTEWKSYLEWSGSKQ